MPYAAMASGSSDAPAPVLTAGTKQWCLSPNERVHGAKVRTKFCSYGIGYARQLRERVD
jgi:hypothetical protein